MRGVGKKSQTKTNNLPEFIALLIAIFRRLSRAIFVQFHPVERAATNFPAGHCTPHKSKVLNFGLLVDGKQIQISPTDALYFYDIWHECLNAKPTALIRLGG